MLYLIRYMNCCVNTLICWLAGCQKQLCVIKGMKKAGCYTVIDLMLVLSCLINTVLSRIEAPSLIVAPSLFRILRSYNCEIKYSKINAFFISRSKLFPFFTFSTLKINLQNTKHCFYVILNLFCIQIKLKVEMKVASLVFLIVAHSQKLVLAPGTTIRDNTVCVISFLPLQKHCTVCTS